MEKEENRKTAFLQEGISDLTFGRTSLQLTIKKWSANEMYFWKLTQEIIKQSAEKGSFMSSLQEGVSQNMIKPAKSKIIIERSNKVDLSGVTTGQPQVTRMEPL